MGRVEVENDEVYGKCANDVRPISCTRVTRVVNFSLSGHCAVDGG